MRARNFESHSAGPEGDPSPSAPSSAARVAVALQEAAAGLSDLAEGVPLLDQVNWLRDIRWQVAEARRLLDVYRGRFLEPSGSPARLLHPLNAEAPADVGPAPPEPPQAA